MSIYIVKPGDTINSIARRNGVTVERLVNDNGIFDPDMLVVGQALVILRPAVVYKVREGDSLYKIAAQFRISVNTLYQNNPELSGLPDIYPGQILVIAYDTRKRKSLIVNGYAYPYIEREVLRKTLPYLTYLTIFGYGMTETGELITTDDEELIKIAREYGTQPVMLLSSLGENGNFSNELTKSVLSSNVSRNNVVNNVVNTMINKGYAAVDVDFEYVLPENRDEYTSFISDLRKAAKDVGKLVFVSLAPKTSATQKGLLYEAHDYEVLGSAADKALLMTYEWGYRYSSPMAVAPIDKVSEVLRYAKSEIPGSKLLMGIPNYAYNWTLPYISGESEAIAVSNVGAQTLASDNNAEIMFDEMAQTPYYTYTDEGGIEHEVWFEDARSVLAKLNLAIASDISGISVWQIMRYFPAMWAVISSNINIIKA